MHDHAYASAHQTVHPWELWVDLVAHILGSLFTSNEILPSRFLLLYESFKVSWISHLFIEANVADLQPSRLAVVRAEAKGAIVAFLPRQQLSEYAFFSSTKSEI